MSVDHIVDTRYYRANIKGVFKTNRVSTMELICENI